MKLPISPLTELTSYLRIMSATLWCPKCLATMSAVLSWLSRTVVSAPACRRRLAVSSRPSMAATKSGLQPSPSLCLLTFAPERKMKHLLLIIVASTQHWRLTSPQQDRDELVSLAVTEHSFVNLAGNKFVIFSIFCRELSFNRTRLSKHSWQRRTVEFVQCSPDHWPGLPGRYRASRCLGLPARSEAGWCRPGAVPRCRCWSTSDQNGTWRPTQESTDPAN